MLVADNDIPELVSDVFSTVLSMDIEPAGPTMGLISGEHAVVAAVTIDGAWNGTVEVACSYLLSQRITGVMFEMEAEETQEEDIADAIGEVVNMVGGHMKSLLEGENKLGLPEIAWEYGLTRADGEVEARIVLNCAGEPVVITTFARQEAGV